MSTLVSEAQLARAFSEFDAAPASNEQAVDGVAPQLLVTPASVEELAAALAAAQENDAAVIPRGGGRHIGVGNIPTHYQVALSTSKLDRVIDYSPTDLTIEVEAGVTLERLGSMLAEHGQHLPLDGPSDATLGGALSANASGPSRHAYGLPRDWLLGCRVAHPDGSISKGGGRVVKNVAGYDMPRLYVGALGTLGVIAEVTLKVAPEPPAQETLLVASDSPSDATALAFEAERRGLALRCAAVTFSSANSSVVVGLWLAGPDAAVRRSADDVERIAQTSSFQRLDKARSAAWWESLKGFDCAPHRAVALRASLQPTDVAPFLSIALQQPQLTIEGVAYPMTGLAVLRLDALDNTLLAGAVQNMRRWAEVKGGSLVVAGAPLPVKQRLDTWGDTIAVPEIYVRLKNEFDPLGILSPGRFAGGL